jgi:hypothetical protein
MQFLIFRPDQLSGMVLTPVVKTEIMERHTTRGGWKPVKHERILKPEFQKDDDENSGSERQGKDGPFTYPGTHGFHGGSKEKFS